MGYMWGGFGRGFGPGFGWMYGGGFMGILFLVLIGIVIYLVVKRSIKSTRNTFVGQPENNALEIAKIRYAQGEITLEQYQEIVKVIKD